MNYAFRLEVWPRGATAWNVAKVCATFEEANAAYYEAMKTNKAGYTYRIIQELEPQPISEQVKA